MVFKEESVIEALKASRHRCDNAVDDVGKDKQLIWQCHEFLQPEAVLVVV